MTDSSNKSSIFLVLGNVYYKASKKSAMLKSDYLQYRLTSKRSPKSSAVLTDAKQQHIVPLVRLDDRLIDQVTFTEVADFMQTGQCTLTLLNLPELLRAAHFLGISELSTICSDFLLQYLHPDGAKTDDDTTKANGLPSAILHPSQLRVLETERNCPSKLFPSLTYMTAEAVKHQTLQRCHHLVQIVQLTQPTILREAVLAATLPSYQTPLASPLSFRPLEVSGAPPGPKPTLFTGLGVKVAPEQYVYDESEILYMMELTSASEAKDIFREEMVKWEDELSSPRALSEEWELSPAKSVDLDKEFPDVPRETLYILYSDD